MAVPCAVVVAAGGGNEGKKLSLLFDDLLRRLGRSPFLYPLINGYKGYFGQNWALNDPNRDPNDLNGPPKGPKWTQIIVPNKLEQPQFFPKFRVWG